MADQASRQGERYASGDILEYVAKLHGAHDSALTQAFTVPAGVPAIMVGPSEGRLLALLARLAGAKRAVEVGTLLGYSAIHLLRGMGAGARLWTVEADPTHAELARANLAAAGFAEACEVRLGRGAEVLPTLASHGPFDLVFLDADKDGYPGYAAWAFEHLRPGGVILGDNAFLFGELLKDSPRAQAMRSFHELVASRCDSVCIPTPDGLVLGIVR